MSTGIAAAERGARGPYASPEQQGEASDLGMWVFLTTETLFFGALFFAYLVTRLRFPAAFAAAGRHTDLALGTLNTAVLLTSSLAMALAGRAALLRARGAAIALMGATVVLGVIFLLIKGYEYRAEYLEHLLPGADFRFDPALRYGAQLFFWLYFVMTGVHAVHLAIGLVLVGFAALRLSRRGFGVQTPGTIEIVGLYWHFVDVVWIFLYPCLYLIARS